LIDVSTAFSAQSKDIMINSVSVNVVDAETNGPDVIQLSVRFVTTLGTFAQPLW
jgi:hypothetical protein